MGAKHLTHMPHIAHSGQTKVERYKWRNDTIPGQLIWVNKNVLRVDQRYQRKLKEEKVKAIASAWSWPAFGALIVGKRPDASLWIITGQHRHAAALRRADVDDLPCIVFDMEEIRQEAEAFLIEATNKKPLTSVEKFKALLECGDEAAQLVQKLLIADNREAANTPSSSGIRCIASLHAVAKKDPEQLKRCWPLLSELCKNDVMPQKLVEGLFALDMNASEQITSTHWRGRILKVGSKNLLDAANRSAAFYARGGANVWARGMLNAINKGLVNRLRWKGENENDDQKEGVL